MDNYRDVLQKIRKEKIIPYQEMAIKIGITNKSLMKYLNGNEMTAIVMMKIEKYIKNEGSK